VCPDLIWFFLGGYCNHHCGSTSRQYSVRNGVFFVDIEGKQAAALAAGLAGDVDDDDDDSDISSMRDGSEYSGRP
jgi:hypothetical protein